MENKNNNLNTQPVETVMEIKPRRVWWKYVLGIIAMTIFIFSAYVAWYQYFSPEAKRNRETQENYQKYLDWQAGYEKAMREDTYGGKTPEETLKMFIEALKKEDIELASKYFMLRDDGQPDPKWIEGLIKTKEVGKLQEIIDLLSKAKPDLEARISEEYYIFSTRNENGTVTADIDLRLNKYSSVWKIESL